MSPTNPHIPNQLRCLIYYHLDNDLLRNALFLAGRLHAYEPRSAESCHLLALCHLRLGELKPAYDHSKSHAARGSHLGCAYVFAQACLQLENHKEKEGISALERSRGLWGSRNNWKTTRRHLPDAAAAHCLLGKLWHGHGDLRKAVDCYVESLKLNPFMWDAFLGLCNTGTNIRIGNVFKITPEMAAVFSLSGLQDGMQDSFSIPEESGITSAPLQFQRNKANPDPFSGPFGRNVTDGLTIQGGSGLFQKFNESTSTNITPVISASGRVNSAFDGMDTPTGAGGSMDGDSLVGGRGADIAIAGAVEPPHAPIRKVRAVQGVGSDTSIEGGTRIRSMSNKSTVKVSGEVEDTATAAASMRRLGVSNTTTGDRKRTITGQPTQQSTSLNNDPAAAPQRRSVRLFNQIRPTTGKFSSSGSTTGFREGRDLKKAKAPGVKARVGSSSSNIGRAPTANRRTVEPLDTEAKDAYHALGNTNVPGGLSKSTIVEASKQQEALYWLLELFKKLGSGYFALAHFKCQDALKLFSTLPASQRDTPWVLSQMGRAFYEQASYVEAEKYFRRIRSSSHARLEDMEIYSTILWHLKNEVELSYLAHELIDVDRLSPQAWCAVGNTFSLQRDHDQALMCFKRATQLQPKFAYAFTLQGHEHVANEEYDKALTAYRNGLAADGRHYNGWYGLGKVYEKMGKYDVAEKHFRTAAAINPTNAVLICCIGMVLEKLKNPRAALVQYTEACQLDPKSALSRFKKARCLMALQEPHLALSELTILKDIAPDEANVHFLLGRLFKTLRQKSNAIKHFTIAMNLDPKASQYIKQSIESLEEELPATAMTTTADEDGEMS
ncbi:MAG: hypothetical protein M1825_004315 [Sarcosagium campestre]|nr:MAG: hypothetical protein M1825_004315 [Sarcosagium campestre]